VPKTKTLTELNIKNIRPPTKGQTVYWDTLTGFGVRVSQGGTKTFMVVHGKDRRRTSIGRYPLMSLAQARTTAKQLLAEYTLNPYQKKPSKTYDDAVAQYLSVRAPEVRASTLVEYRRCLTKHFMFTSQVEDIQTNQIIDQLDRIKSQAEKSHAYTALKIFLNWCVERQYREFNPLQRVKKPAGPASRERVLSDEELVAVWKATGDHMRFNVILRVLLLTGQRANQIASLRTEWIDWDKSLITFPAEIMKNKQEHVLPVGRVTLAMLRNMTPQRGYLFAQSRETKRPFAGWNKCKRALDETASVSDWKIHDLRRSWATNAPQLGILPHITDRILSHYSARGLVASIYDRHTYLEPMREAVDRMESHVLGLVISAKSDQQSGAIK